MKNQKKSNKLEKFQEMFVSVCTGLLPPAIGSEYILKIQKLEKSGKIPKNTG
jgi:hypothetical protein